MSGVGRFLVDGPELLEYVRRGLEESRDVAAVIGALSEKDQVRLAVAVLAHGQGMLDSFKRGGK